MKIAIANHSNAGLLALRKAISTCTEHQVIWTASNGIEAVRQCAQRRPDLLLMDLAMGEVDGVEATRLIMQDAPCAILIVTATPEEHSNLVFRAMGAGALDVTATPVPTGDANDGAALLAKIRTIGKLIQADHPSPRRAQPHATADPADSTITTLIAIGASTGGPTALVKVLSGLCVPPAAAVVIVQHIDVRFADSFAAWLSGQIAQPVQSVDDGMPLHRSGIFLAKTNDHLHMDQRQHLRYSPEPADYPYRPSINVFFQCLSRNWPHDAVGVVLTGMGKDGAEGLLAMHRAGSLTIAQDRGSAVYGMPRAAAELGAARYILPVEEIGAALQMHLDGVRRTPIAEGLI